MSHWQGPGISAAAREARAKTMAALTARARAFISTPVPTRSAFRACPLGDSSTVEQRTLTPLILVRIQVPQPRFPAQDAKMTRTP